MDGPTDTKACWPAGTADRLFLALTFVLVIIVVLVCRNAGEALALIVLLLALPGACIAQSGTVQGCFDGLARACGFAARGREGFWPLPGPTAPYAVAAPPPPEAGSRYPGAIDVDEYDTETAWGHRDRTVYDRDGEPEGNPHDLMRICSEDAAGPCVDDEANMGEINGDEGMVYQGLHRNDATRVAAGTMNRRRDLPKYISEELDIAQDREWWGRHEV